MCTQKVHFQEQSRKIMVSATMLQKQQKIDSNGALIIHCIVSDQRLSNLD